MPRPAANSTGRAPTDAEFAALAINDAASDGSFIYGVKSTGIYCHPSCKSRAPKRDNVRIFADWQEAEAAGFRPCKRCRPERGTDADPRLERARQLIDAAVVAGEKTPSLKALGSAAHIGATHLQRRFTAAYGLSPKAYAEAGRAEKLKEELRLGRSVTDAIYGAGFGAASRLYEKSGKLLGMTPADYRRGGKGLTLIYAIRPCRLGRALVALSERGVAALLLGDGEAAMLKELREEFGAAQLRRDDKVGSDVFAALDAMLAGTAVAKNLPLDLRGTAFQIKVWQALQAIPAGETRTYREIAQTIGKPKAIRAVGSACANNILGLLVPCHRALRSDGGLGGYRWGLARKRAILDLESDPPRKKA